MQDTDSHPSIASAPASLHGWLRLTQAPGVGPAACRLLLDRFSSPEAVFAAPVAAVIACVGAARARALASPSREAAAAIDTALAWAQLPGNTILTLHDPAYPAALRHIDDAPAVLYVSGRLALLQSPCLAIVGSRNASLQGQANAEVMANALGVAGLTIVSGLALGIDTAAHRGALDGGGATVAVVGTGPDLVYPARNRALRERIALAGCVVSEYPPGTPPLAHNFPQRNRIISGLSAGVLVVEAAARSGSLITARLAASQGREVFAVPGSIHSALSKGCHLLLKEGARLVESAADVLEELHHLPLIRMAAASAPATAGADEHGHVLDAMGHDPLDSETLASASGRPPHELGLALLELELAGRIERLADGRYQRLAR